MNASSSLNEDIFTQKFFTSSDTEDKSNPALLQLLPSDTPTELQAFIASDKGKEFKKEVRTIIDSIKAWAQTKRINTDELDELWRINFASYSGSNLERNQDIVVLYRDGVIALDKILKTLNSDKDPFLEQRCENALRNSLAAREY